MSERVLVAYASKNGATAEIAAAIAEEFRAVGLFADLAEVASIRELDQYRTVVLGSAVYMGRWRAEARRFLKRHHRELSERSVWLFSSGPVGEQAADAERSATPRIITELGPKIGIREHVVFGGRVPAKPSNFVERARVRDTPKERRDLRNWEQIRHWAHHIALSMAELSTATAA